MGIASWLASVLGSGQNGREAEEELLSAVEEVADLVDPTIRYVSGYRRKLKPAVARTLEYCKEMTAKIPGPFHVGKDSWGREPLIHSLFSSPEEMRAFLSGSAELQARFGQEGTSECFGLLTMTREEKHTLGIERDGDIVKRNVPQTAVSFLDHRLVAASATEAETRGELRLRALAILSTHIMEEILFLKSWKQELSAEKKILETKLRVRQAGHRGVSGLFCDDAHDRETAEAASVLAELDEKLAAVRSEISGPEDYVKQVVKVLVNPEKYFRMERYRLNLTPMGILAREGSNEPAHEVELCEFNLSERARRSGVLIRLSRDALGL